jgi:MFS family permease
VWSNRDFTRFWVGETVSLMGVQVTALALPLVAVLTLHAGPEQTGMLRFAQFIPFLLLSLLFGVWADRRRKRPLMIGANMARAVLIAMVPLLAAVDALSIGVLYLLAMAIGVCTVLFDVCWMSYVPSLVDKEHLVSANGKVSSSYSAADMAGPGIAGGLVQLLTAPYAMTVDAVSYVASVVMLASIRRPEPEPVRDGSHRRLKQEIGEGIIFVGTNPFLRTIAVIGSSYNFCFMFIEGIFVLYAVRVLGFSAAAIGLVLAVSAAGGLLGALSAQAFTARFAFGRVYLFAVIVGYCGPLLVPAAHGPVWLAAVLVAAGYFLMRFGLAVANVVAISLRQAVTPHHLMGRMTAGMRTLLSGVGSLGALAGGFLGAALGLREALWVAATASAAATLPLFFSVIPRLPSLPDTPEDALAFAAQGHSPRSLLRTSA